MTKTKITNADLTFLIFERLKEFPECVRGIPVAVVRTEDAGTDWAIVTGRKHEARHPGCLKRIRAVEKQLRAIYSLARG